MFYENQLEQNQKKEIIYQIIQIKFSDWLVQKVTSLSQYFLGYSHGAYLIKHQLFQNIKNLTQQSFLLAFF
jgi:hypothetical protein